MCLCFSISCTSSLQSQPSIQPFSSICCMPSVPMGINQNPSLSLSLALTVSRSICVSFSSQLGCCNSAVLCSVFFFFPPLLCCWKVESSVLRFFSPTPQTICWLASQLCVFASAQTFPVYFGYKHALLPQSLAYRLFMCSTHICTTYRTWDDFVVTYIHTKKKVELIHAL
jgi:hypothetical protein